MIMQPEDLAKLKVGDEVVYNSSRSGHNFVRSPIMTITPTRQILLANGARFRGGRRMSTQTEFNPYGYICEPAAVQAHLDQEIRQAADLRIVTLFKNTLDVLGNYNKTYYRLTPELLADIDALRVKLEAHHKTITNPES